MWAAALARLACLQYFTACGKVAYLKAALGQACHVGYQYVLKCPSQTLLVAISADAFCSHAPWSCHMQAKKVWS